MESAAFYSAMEFTGDALLEGAVLPMPSALERLEVRSNAFKDGDPIPHEYSAYGENHSPQISWRGTNSNCQAIALLCEDPDAPRDRPFVHWMVANLPCDYMSVGVRTPSDSAPLYLRGGIQGTNDAGTAGWFGPRPPAGDSKHHYHFYVYALGRKLDLSPGFSYDEFRKALNGNVIAQGELVGTYERRP